MHVKVRLYTTLVNYVPDTGVGIPFDFELDDNATISDLLKHLKLPRGDVKTIFVNGRSKPVDYELTNDDEIGIFPLVGGG